jgi:hypothetical protein
MSQYKRKKYKEKQVGKKQSRRKGGPKEGSYQWALMNQAGEPNHGIYFMIFSATLEMATTLISVLFISDFIELLVI